MIKEKIDKIMSIMNSIEYGFKDENGKNIIINNPQKWDNHFENFYYLLEPEELLEKKCGVCWDQVELERKLFDEENIDFKTFFIYASSGDMLPSHTFLIYMTENRYYWFENSWAKYRGIHEYDTELSLLLDVINKFKKEHNEIDNFDNLYLYEYQKPIKHIKCDDFYKYIETQKKIEFN